MKKNISLLLVALMVLSFCGCGKTKRGNDLMHEAYMSVVNDGFLYYSIYDIDKNGVEEIIVYNEGKAFEIPEYNYSCKVYTFDGNGPVCVGEFQTKNKIYGSENGGIWSYSSNFSGEELRHYNIKDNVLADGDSSLRTYNDGDMNYLIQEKAVSDQEYKEIYDKLFGIEVYDDRCVLDEFKDDAEQIGEVIGHTIYTDIVTKINGCDIPSYNVNGLSVVSADVLENYGFVKMWDEKTRSINVIRDYNKTEVNSFYKAENVAPEMIGKRAYNVLRTDITSYIDGKSVTGYNIKGEIFVCFEDLVVFGAVEYDEATKVLSLSLDGLSGTNYKENIFNRHRITVDTMSEGMVIATFDGNELWRKTVYEGEGSISGAYIAGNTVYYGTDKRFYASDLNTGADKWSIEIDACDIKAFATAENIVTVLMAYGTGVRHIAVNNRGELMYDENYTDEDGTGSSLPDSISEIGGNVVTLQFTNAAGAGINMWQKVNIAA